MQWSELHPHPAEPAAPGLALRAGLALQGPRALALRFELAAPAGAVAWPGPASLPARRDGLWQHTCCELFLHADGGAGYLEFNLSPCGDWAAYAFGGYRQRVADPEVSAPAVRAWRDEPAGRFVLEATLALPSGARAGMRCGLSMVLAAAAADAVSYPGHWALAHPRARPDFHDAAGHVLALASTHGASA